MGGRRAAIAVIAAAAFVAGAAVAAGDGEAQDHRPTGAELRRIQERVDDRSDELDRQGIYVIETGLPAQPCVMVRLANPTAAGTRHPCADGRDTSPPDRR